MNPIANCPEHGLARFEYRDGPDWWECPNGVLDCGSVIPAERVTPDGAEVARWDFENRRWA